MTAAPVLEIEELRDLVKAMDEDGIWKILDDAPEYRPVAEAARSFITDEEGAETRLYEVLKNVD